MRLNGYKSSASNEAAKIMMGFVDFLISGLAFDMILNLFYALFFAERLFRSKVEILEEEVTKTGIHFGTQNAVEAMLETLEECFRSPSAAYISKRKAEHILRNLQDSFWRMSVVQGHALVFRTWEPIFVSTIMLASQLISSTSLKLDYSKFGDSLQYIELVTVTAILTVNVALLFMNIGSTSQKESYKISIGKSNALFSALGA